MKFTISLIVISSLIMSTLTIFDFSNQQDWSGWQVVNDTVMGGESTSKIVRNDAGNGVFKGSISLDNNGGFASLRYSFDTQNTKEYSTAILHLKGDAKQYQFRVKEDARDRFSYVHNFETSGEWQQIEIPLKEMYPTFRGRKLDRPNFSGSQMEEVRFLIGNKKPQDFALEIDKITLQ